MGARNENPYNRVSGHKFAKPVRKRKIKTTALHFTVKFWFLIKKKKAKLDTMSLCGERPSQFNGMSVNALTLFL